MQEHLAARQAETLTDGKVETLVDEAARLVLGYLR
ncbi:hypothetical protein ABIC66_003684 [Caulobacter sp. 1776]